MIDYRLFYPEGSIADDRRDRQLQARGDKRIFQLPPRRTSRFGGRR
ncbi:MAG: hypothetical protein ACXWWL_02730 [Candidatus Limnocylindria bacterium]